MLSNGMCGSSVYAGSKTPSTEVWCWKKVYTTQLCLWKSRGRGPGTETLKLKFIWESVHETRGLLRRLLESFEGRPARNSGARATTCGKIL
jgi:hypothetical protein